MNITTNVPLQSFITIQTVNGSLRTDSSTMYISCDNQAVIADARFAYMEMAYTKSPEVDIEYVYYAFNGILSMSRTTVSTTHNEK